jgi:hypothetical protein
MVLTTFIVSFPPQIEEILQATVEYSPIDLCREEFKDCWDLGCTTEVTYDTGPYLVNTNQTSLVGANATFTQGCVCATNDFTDAAPKCDLNSCMNGGTCQETWNGFK